jgi:cytoskeletal protein RodZ
MSITDASALTKLKPTYLEALELDRFEDLPALFYAKNFLIIYANALGLDGKALAQEFGGQHRIETALPPPHQVSMSYHFVVGVGRLLRSRLVLVAMLILLILLVGYFVGGESAPGARGDINTNRVMADYRPVYDAHEPLPSLP